MSRFLSSRFESLKAYTPGEQPRDQKYIKLNTNESPYPPSNEVLKRVSEAEVSKLNLYPDPTGKVLKKKIADLYGVEPENIFLSNGSDDILNFAFMAFCDKEHGVAFPDISYGFYPVYAKLHGIPSMEIPLKSDFSIDINDYKNTGMMTVLANPNAPTGMTISLEAIEDLLLTNKDQVFLVDEAYVDFGGEDAAKLTKKYENLLVVQTFSKSRSLAGGRLGFAIASKELIEDLEKIKFSTNPYCINRLTMIAGEASIDSNDYYMENAKKIIDTREHLVLDLKENGFHVLDSKANFIFVEYQGIPGKVLYEKLKERGVLVRYFSKERIDNFIRVSIGTKEDMKVFETTLLGIVKEEKGE